LTVPSVPTAMNAGVLHRAVRRGEGAGAGAVARVRDGEGERHGGTAADSGWGRIAPSGGRDPAAAWPQS
jgi:hypothetical protein